MTPACAPDRPGRGGGHEAAAVVFDLDGTLIDWFGLIAAYTAYYDAHHDRLCRPFPGVPEMLAALVARGVRTGVATSKRRRSTRQAIERCGLSRWIGAAVSAEDVPAPKPAADPVLVALRCLGVKPARAWMVGDGVFDMEAARRAGVRSVAALWGTRERQALLGSRPDYLAASPDRVVSLVASG